MDEISSLPLDFASVFNSVWQHDSIANLACGTLWLLLLRPSSPSRKNVGSQLAVTAFALEDILLC
jgi:hypothetical protein